MATIDEYGSGHILLSIRLARAALQARGIPFMGPVLAGMLEHRMESFAIRPVTLKEAAAYIRQSRCCAAGPRVCAPLFPESPQTEAIFLDDLAEAMTSAGKARIMTGEEACSILARYPGNPILLSKVSGQYLEICRSEPSVCIYWKIRGTGSRNAGK